MILSVLKLGATNIYFFTGIYLKDVYRSEKTISKQPSTKEVLYKKE